MLKGIVTHLQISPSMQYVLHFAPFRWIREWYREACSNRSSTMALRLGLAEPSPLRDKESVLAFAKEVIRIRKLAEVAIVDCNETLHSLGVVWPQWQQEWLDVK